MPNKRHTSDATEGDDMSQATVGRYGVAAMEADAARASQGRWPRICGRAARPLAAEKRGCLDVL